MEIVQPKICLSMQEAVEVRDLLFKYADLCRGSYWASDKDADRALASAGKLNDCILKID